MLREKLQTLNKDGLTIAEYILKLKLLEISISDRISEIYILLYILRGLGLRYNNFVSNIKMR